MKAGRMVEVNLPYSAGGYAGWSVVDFKLNPELGILELYAEGSNYRRYRARVLLSAGAKQLLKEKKFEGRVFVFEERQGRMPKLYIDSNINDVNAYIAIVTYGSGYRGSMSTEKRGDIRTLTGACGGGSLGDVCVDLMHVVPPAMFIVKRSGRLYGKPPYAVAIFTKDRVVVEELSASEIEEYWEAAGGGASHG